MLNDKCPIWNTYAVGNSLFRNSEESGPRYAIGYEVNSPRTSGNYSIDIETYRQVGSSSYSTENKRKLTTWIIDQRRFGVSSPKVTTEILEYISGARVLTVAERSNRLLRFIADLNPDISSRFHFYPGIETTTNGPSHDQDLLAVTESTTMEEVEYLLKYLSELGFLKGDSDTSLGRIDYVISPKGHNHLDELSKLLVDSSQGFVAMWFDDSLADVCEKGIEAGIKEAGYSPRRIDKVDHNNKIDDEIIAEIRRSRFLVADFTQNEKGARGGVYYEAGFAHGLNIPVIFTVRKDCLESVHFDTRQYNHILWEDAEDLYRQLAQRISASIGDGPFKNK